MCIIQILYMLNSKSLLFIIRRLYILKSKSFLCIVRFFIYLKQKVYFLLFRFFMYLNQNSLLLHTYSLTKISVLASVECLKPLQNCKNLTILTLADNPLCEDACASDKLCELLPGVICHLSCLLHS